MSAPEPACPFGHSLPAGRHGASVGTPVRLAARRYVLVQLAARLGQADALGDAMRAAFGLELPLPGHAAVAGELTALWMQPATWLLMAPPGEGYYAASKHAIEGFSESLRRELMLFGIDVVIVAPGPVKTPIWGKGQETIDAARYQNSPYLPALQKIGAFMQHLDAIALPPEKIAALVFDALTLPNPKVRYHIAPDTMRHLLAAVLPKRTMDRIIAKRLGLLPPAT